MADLLGAALREELRALVREAVREVINSESTSPRPEWLDETQVSRRTGIPVGTLQVWRHRGRGPRFAKFGRKVMYAEAAIASWESASTQ